MPRPRFYRLSPERQQAILDIAADTFAEHGYEGASYNQILDDIGLSKGSAYYTFEGKADLYQEVLRREVSQVIEALPAPAGECLAPDYWRDMRAWIAASLRFAVEHPRFMALTRGFIVARSSGQLPEMEHQLDQLASGWIEGSVVSGQQTGAVRTDVDAHTLSVLSASVLGALDGEMLMKQLPPEGPAMEAIIDLYVDMLRRLLEPGQPRSF